MWQLVSILSYRVAFRCGLTADSRLRIAVVFECGSLLELRGLMPIKLLQSAHLCWWVATLPESGHYMAIHEALPPPLRLRHRNREDVSGQSTQTMWRHHVMLLCVLDSRVMRWRPVADWPSIEALQAASTDRSSDNYRPVSSMWAVKQGLRETCFHAQYRPISGHRNNRKVVDSTIDIAILRNRYEPTLMCTGKEDWQLTSAESMLWLATAWQSPSTVLTDNLQTQWHVDWQK